MTFNLWHAIAGLSGALTFFFLVLYSIVKKTEEIMADKATCTHPNARNMPFCPDCGGEMNRTCPKCKQTVAVKDSFCSFCGAELTKSQAAPGPHSVDEPLQKS